MIAGGDVESGMQQTDVSAPELFGERSVPTRCDGLLQTVSVRRTDDDHSRLGAARQQGDAAAGRGGSSAH